MQNKSQEFYVSEIFTSMQGEGFCAGKRAGFLRFQFCNLKCSWCDSSYTFTTTTGHYSIYSLSELRNKLAKLNHKDIVITGGEPLLQSFHLLYDARYNFHIETNGEILPNIKHEFELPNGRTLVKDVLPQELINKFYWVVSPKLNNCGIELSHDNLKYWSSLNNIIFKFIIRTSSDILEIKKIVQEYSLDNEKIYLGLEGTTPASQMNSKLVDEILLAGYNFSPRLHVLLWGNEREK